MNSSIKTNTKINEEPKKNISEKKNIENDEPKQIVEPDVQLSSLHTSPRPVPHQNVNANTQVNK